MPAFAPNFTPRLKIRYHAAFANHTQLWRFPELGAFSAGATAAVAAVQAFYDDIATWMFDDWAILDTSIADVDSDVFVPFAGPTVTGTQSTAGVPNDIKAGAVSFVGHTANGQPAKVAQFGFNVPAMSGDNALDFRFSAGEVAEIDTAIAELNGFLVGLVLCGSDGSGISWKPYANFKDYDYWVKRVRSGG